MFHEEKTKQKHTHNTNKKKFILTSIKTMRDSCELLLFLGPLDNKNIRNESCFFSSLGDKIISKGDNLT